MKRRRKGRDGNRKRERRGRGGREGGKKSTRKKGARNPRYMFSFALSIVGVVYDSKEIER